MPAPPQGPASLLWARTGCPLLRPHALDLGRDRAAAGGHLREGQTHSSPRRSDGTHAGSAPAPGHWLWTVDPRARTREGFRPGHQLGAPSQLGFGPGQGLRTAPPAGPGRGGPTGSSPTRPAHHTATPGPAQGSTCTTAPPPSLTHAQPVPTHGTASDTRQGRRPARARERRAGPEPSPERVAAPRRGDPGAGAGGAAPRHAQHAVRGRCSFTWPPPPAPPAPGGPRTCAPDLRVGPCAPRLCDPAPQCPMPGPLHTAALPLADSFLVLMILAAYSWPVQSLTQRRTTEKAPLGVTWGTETEREPISVPADTQHPAMRPSPGQRDPRREGPPQTPRCPHSPPARQACPSSAGRAPAPGGPLGSAGSRASGHPWCSVPSSGDPQVPPHGHSLVGPLGTH